MTAYEAVSAAGEKVGQLCKKNPGSAAVVDSSEAIEIIEATSQFANRLVGTTFCVKMAACASVHLLSMPFECFEMLKLLLFLVENYPNELIFAAV